MPFTFVPEYYFDKFNDIDYKFFINNNISFVILDVDNTLEPYEHPLPGEHVVSWLNELRLNGIQVAFVSNNNGERLKIFNENLQIPAFTSAKKPFKCGIVKAMKALGASADRTMAMGDQIFTDVWAAHNAGIKAILVNPINDRKDLLTKFKRLLEIPVKKKYYRKMRKGN